MRCILFGHRPVSHPVVRRGGAEEITICADCGSTLSAPRGLEEQQPRGYEAVRADHFARQQ